MTARIVVVGSFNMDLTTYMERLPRPGETVHGRKFVTGPGGKGSNQAVAAARLGATVTFVGRVGTDSFGDTAIQTWQSEGINTAYVVRDPENATGVAPIWVDDEGENSIVVALGANLALSKGDVEAAREEIAQADVLIVQLEIDLDTVAHALLVAKDHDVTTILNPAPAAHLPESTLALADFLTPNETELQTLYDDVPDDLRQLVQAGGPTLVMTAGSRGAVWATESDSGEVPTYKVDVVDTTGAGDAFNAGLAVALAEGKPLAEAIAFANATAAMCVTRPGTAPSMPQRREVEALMQQT
ncbi:MAG: ribokinase [Anaerolineaceae bacterium]|nr:ribokinase [Anaerolineaceae bacterium]